MRPTFGPRSVRLALAAIVVFAIGGGIAYAAIPDGGGVYHACMLKSVGTIRIVDPDKQHCLAALETEITFNQKGPKGDPGIPGAPGSPGAGPTVAQLAAGDPNCPAGGAAITDAAGSTAYVCSGQNGADGQPFSGTFKSPNQLYSISVSDTGITLTGPGATTVIKLSGGDVTVQSDHDLKLQSGNNTDVKASSNVTVKASGTADVESSGFFTLKGSSMGINGGAGACPSAARVGDSFLGTGGGDLGPPFGTIITGSSTVCIG